MEFFFVYCIHQGIVSFPVPFNCDPTTIVNELASQYGNSHVLRRYKEKMVGFLQFKIEGTYI